MPEVTQETFPRYSIDETGTVNVQIVTRTTIDGENFDRYWRRAVAPDDDDSDLSDDVRAVIAAARRPRAVARFEARKAKQEKP
jgi:hypothetical protein